MISYQHSLELVPDIQKDIKAELKVCFPDKLESKQLVCLFIVCVFCVFVCMSVHWFLVLWDWGPCCLLPYQRIRYVNFFCCHTFNDEIHMLQESTQEGVITRDIHRTFPAHDYFKDTDGDGQDSLYKICKVTFGSYLRLQYPWNPVQHATFLSVPVRLLVVKCPKICKISFSSSRRGLAILTWNILGISSWLYNIWLAVTVFTATVSQALPTHDITNISTTQ